MNAKQLLAELVKKEAEMNNQEFEEAIEYIAMKLQIEKSEVEDLYIKYNL